MEAGTRNRSASSGRAAPPSSASYVHGHPGRGEVAFASRVGGHPVAVEARREVAHVDPGAGLGGEVGQGRRRRRRRRRARPAAPGGRGADEEVKGQARASRDSIPERQRYPHVHWNTVDADPRWCCTYLLDPSDALFIDVGQAFIRQQIKEYGDVTNIYNCDTFNENTPPTNEPAYISSLGSAIYDAMSRGNKDAVWLMQGWLFYSDSAFWKEPQMKALLHSVPIGKMIVLDLFADVKPIWKASSQFYGVPYIWCLLHNFGGNIEMYGILDSISSGPIDARTSYNSTMIGVGMCMEGIEQNPVVYELMSEMAFHNKKVEVEDWLKNYSYRRYGQANAEIEKAWRFLYHTIYNCTDGIAV